MTKLTTIKRGRSGRFRLQPKIALSTDSSARAVDKNQKIGKIGKIGNPKKRPQLPLIAVDVSDYNHKK